MTDRKGNITYILKEVTQANPDKISIAEQKKSYSYSQLFTEIKRTAAYYQAKGIKKGDRVLILIPMSIQLYVQVIALFYIGAAAVFVDSWAGRSRILDANEVAKCKGVIGSWKVRLWYVINKRLRQIPIFLRPGQKSNDEVLIAETSDHSEALVTFTTGSTGKPKAANRTHQFLRAQYEILSKKLSLDDNDIELTTLPIVLLCSLAAGTTSIIPDLDPTNLANFDPANIWAQMTDHRVSRLIGSPHFISQIAKHKIQQKQNGKSVKQIFSGGAPVFPKEAALWIKAFPNTAIEIIYGSTEAEPISSIDAKILSTFKIANSKGLCVGSVHPKTRLIILPIEDQVWHFKSKKEFFEMELAKGNIGEILVTGPHVLQAYINDPEAEKMNKIKVGNTIWHRTGDAGFIHEDGNLYLVGRAKETFIHQQTLYSTFLHEYKLSLIPEIQEGTIIKVNKDIYTIVVSSKDNSAIEKMLKDNDLQVGNIRKVDRLPKDPRHHSKIDYGKLREMMISISE